MEMKFDNETLKADIKLLEARGVESDVAENIAMAKQAIEYATYFMKDIGVEEGDVPDDIYESLSYADALAEEAWWSVFPIFQKIILTKAA